MTDQQPIQTHAVTTPNKRAATPIDVLRGNMEGQFIKDVGDYFGNEKDALAFKVAAVDYVRKMPKLLECNRISLLSAFVQVAAFKFMPMGVNGEAFIIPYGSEAKFQMGYQGYITIFYRAGIKDVKAIIVYDNEHFVYQEGLNTILEHIPTKFGETKGTPVGVYAVATTPAGGKVFKVMSKDEVMAIKNMSKAKDKKDSPWNSGDPEMWMWKKTCLIQLSKLLPKSQEIQRAVELDYEAEGIIERPLDPGGPAVGAVHHGPVASTIVDAETNEVETPRCPKGVHDGSRMSDGDCMACMEEETAAAAGAEPHTPEGLIDADK
jgi:recombination protein RecT